MIYRKTWFGRWKIPINCCVITALLLKCNRTKQKTTKLDLNNLNLWSRSLPVVFQLQLVFCQALFKYLLFEMLVFHYNTSFLFFSRLHLECYNKEAKNISSSLCLLINPQINVTLFVCLVIITLTARI